MTSAASDRLKREKRAFRVRMRALRDALPSAERERACAVIARTVLGLPELDDVRTVMAFASFGTEVDTSPIVGGLDRRGVRVAMPRVDGPDIAAILYRPGDALVAAALGMPEPARGTVVDVGAIDAAVTPGLAFDRGGHRIGYGGGFYDRFFSAARPDLRKIAVCFSVQLIDGELPHGAFDVPVDLIVTEHEVVRTG